MIELLCGVAILVGLVGIAVPILPGLVLVWAGVLVWAIEKQVAAGWVVLGVATLLVLAGLVAKYLVPGRRLAESGVGWRTTLTGTVLGIVGFFVVPVVGLFLGFVLGVYLAERIRLSTHEAAWPSTRRALAAVALSIGIELVTGLLVAATWVVGVVIT